MSVLRPITDKIAVIKFRQPLLLWIIFSIFAPLFQIQDGKARQGCHEVTGGGQEDKMLIFDNIKFVELTLR